MQLLGKIILGCGLVYLTIAGAEAYRDRSYQQAPQSSGSNTQGYKDVGAHGIAWYTCEGNDGMYFIAVKDGEPIDGLVCNDSKIVLLEKSY